MALDTDILKNRLKATFGSDSQKTTANKLNMTQGNVSKLLSGLQQPTVDTLYRINEVYGVSIDWLMGISDRKNVTKIESELSYSLATEIVTELVRNGLISLNKKNNLLSLGIHDPILKKLLEKSNTISKVDEDLYRDWKNAKLSLFNDKPILCSMAFRENYLDNRIDEATTENYLLELYEEAKQEQDIYIYMMSGIESDLGGQ